MVGTGQPLELVPGEILEGKYRVDRLLGVGGMGAVYVAERLALQDRVAIKSILSSQNTSTNRARFLREARAAASIRHPNVVKIFDFGEPQGRPPYMVMELLEGPTLATVIRESGALALARALYLFSGVCAAVEAGHRRGVIHRDLKPGNVILARSDDGRETVKVLDFGLARVVDGSDISALTSPGSMLGTCSYMSPELIESSEASPASDVYALGVLLYEMVTGTSPFRGDNNAATILKITQGDYNPPLSVMPELPQEVAAGIEAALLRDPQSRPRSPEELAARVGAPLAHSASELDPSRLEPSLDVSAIGSPGELEPSMAAVGGASVAEVTMADAGPNLEGGEKTMSGDAVDPHGSSVFIGRARELEQLRRGYRLALDGRGRITVITGDAGVGKSRLIESFAGWAGSQGAVTLRGRFFAYEGDHPPPYETFAWMLGEAGSSASRADAVRGSGNRPVGDGPLRDARDKWHTFSRLAEAFVARSRGRPLVLTLDDLQWATHLDLEFLAYLPRAVEHATVMVVGSARERSESQDAEELGRWLSRLGSQRILTNVRLRGFSTGEVRAWFQACFPGIRIRPQDIRRLEHATGGNPYFLAEVVGQLVDQGEIIRSKLGWACASLDRVELPETVNTVVRARLEGLDEVLRPVLETACVIGEEFRFETLHAALDPSLELDEDALETALERAVKMRLLSDDSLAPGSDYRFETTTLRSVLYGQLAKRRRRRLHRAVVDAIDRLYGDDDAHRIAKVLCYHYDAVEDHANTLEWGLRAAEETLARYDNDHADVSLSRAQRAAATLEDSGQSLDPLVRGRLDLATGALYVRIGRLDEAEEVLRAGMSRLPTGNANLELDMLLTRASCQLARGDLEDGAATGRRAIHTAERLGERSRELDARLHAARCAAPHGDLDQAVALLEPVAAATEPGLAPLRALALSELAWVYTKRGAFDRAVSLTHEALDVARGCGNALAEYRAVSVLGLTYLEGGDQSAAIERLEQALDLARRLSLRRREGVELHNLGECYYFLHRYDEALARSRQALSIFLEIHDRGTEGDVRVNLGRILRAQGNVGSAVEELRAGRELAARAGRSEYVGLARLEQGSIHTDAGRVDEALTELEAARETFAGMESVYLWRAEAALASLAHTRGDRAAAVRHVDRATELIENQRIKMGTTMSDEGLVQALDEVARLLNDPG